MSVRAGRDNEWIERLTPELRAGAGADLSPASSAVVVSDVVEQLGEAAWSWCVRGSHAAVARTLFVHRNTVAYRLGQAEELLGHPIADRELELRVALEIAAALPGGDR